MMNIDEMKCNVDHLLADRGLTTDYQDQTVRLLLYHLYVAMDIYRYMTFSEKNGSNAISFGQSVVSPV